MAYDFDTVIERRGTDCIKFDQAEVRGKSPDLLPLWVADMDFSLPPEILQPLHDRVAHGIFGYSEPNDDYFEAVHDWFATRYDWDVKREWAVFTPGVVFAIGTAIRAFSEPGDNVLIQPPVYYPFGGMIEANGRTTVTSPLVYDAQTHTYGIDFDDFERVVEEASPKVFLLCNPHNPGGRVWTADELRRLGDICMKHDVIVVSDEIHEDFTRPGCKHEVFAKLDERFAARSVICTAPSKTFNIAGLQVSNVFIPNPDLRKRYLAAHRATGYGELNAIGIAAGRACYQHGGPWLDALKEYLEGNLAFMCSYLAEHAPQLAVVEPQSTYLVWVDCSALGLDDEGLRQLVEDKAKLWLDMGTMFGKEGSGFIRFNIACPRATLAQALEQLATAIMNS